LKTAALEQFEKPLLASGKSLVRAFPVKREARSYGMPEIENRRACGDSRFSFAVEQEHRYEAASVRLQDTEDLRDIVLDFIGQHVREDRGDDRQIEGVVVEGEMKGGRGNRTLRIAMSRADICKREVKIRQLRLQLPSTPFDQGQCRIEPLVAALAAQISGEGPRQSPAATTHVQNRCIRSQTAQRGNLCRHFLTASCEQLGIGEWPDPNAQVFRRYGQRL
jgi:hypothetical protein